MKHQEPNPPDRREGAQTLNPSSAHPPRGIIWKGQVDAQWEEIREGSLVSLHTCLGLRTVAHNKNAVLGCQSHNLRRFCDKGCASLNTAKEGALMEVIAVTFQSQEEYLCVGWVWSMDGVRKRGRGPV